MKHNSEQKVEDNLRPPVFWQTQCCLHVPRRTLWFDA